MEEKAVDKVDVIEQSLAKENITNQVIEKLKADYGNLTINGLDDREGFKKVEDARKECKVVRIMAEKICKKGREEAIATQKAWISKEKEVVNQISEVEDKLAAESDRIKEEEKRILFEAAQRAKLPVRVEKLLTIGISVEDEQLLKINDEEFTTLFNEFHTKVLQEKEEAIKKQEAEKQAAIDAENKRKNNLFEKRQEELATIAKYFDECSSDENYLTVDTTEEGFQYLIKHCTNNKIVFDEAQAKKDAEIAKLKAEAEAKQKAEAEQLAKVKEMEALQKKRFDEIMPYNNPVKNKIDLNKLCELSEEDYQRIFSNKKADWEKDQAEQKAIAEKAAAEKKAAEDKAAQLQKELDEKKLAEEKAEADKQAKIEADLAMGDKGKMTSLLTELTSIKTKYEFKSAKHKKLQAEVNGLIDKIVDYATPKN